MLDLRQDHVVSARVATPRPLGARVRLAEASARGLHPDGLASDAILVLKRVAVAWRVDTTDPGELRAAVAERLTRAVRPGRGATGDDADGVLFDSLEELLACLARDGVAGRRPWWWATLGLEPTTFAARWAQSPEALPGVVRRLAAAGALAEVARQITAREAEELLRAVVRHASLSTLAVAVQRIPPARAVLPPGARVDSPWDGSPAAAVVPGVLPPPVEAFVGLAAALASAPERVRRPELAARVVRWAREVAGEVPEGGEAPGNEARRAAVARTTDEVRPSLTPTELRPLPPSPRLGVPLPGSPPAAATSAAGGVDTGAAPVHEPEGESRVSPASGPWRAPPPPRPPAASTPAPSTAPVPGAAAPPSPDPLSLEPSRARSTDATEPEATWVVPTGFPTGLGGAFYLVNVLLALDLYGDFTQPVRAEPEVPLWDVVAAAAAALLPDPPADPLWAFLARLAGRRALVERAEGEAPLPGDFEAPGAGWVVSRPLPAGFPRPADLTTEAWLAAAVEGVRARLTTAIDLPPEAWLAQAARVRDHDHLLEVAFRLSTHPVEVRLAGLDRDPGWVPAAGRDLRFRYDG